VLIEYAARRRAAYSISTAFGWARTNPWTVDGAFNGVPARGPVMMLESYDLTI
jgi:hypothetical protein